MDSGRGFGYCNLLCLQVSRRSNQGIIAAVNHSGDSDSTGSIAGNILGAWNGLSKFDEYWINNLEIKDVIIDMANDMKYIVDNRNLDEIDYNEFVEYRRTMNCHPVEMN